MGYTAIGPAPIDANSRLNVSGNVASTLDATLPEQLVRLGQLPKKSVIIGNIGFGDTNNDYVEASFSTGTWHTNDTYFTLLLRGDGINHNHIDVALEELQCSIIDAVVGTSVTVGVYAPNTTWGNYKIQILAEEYTI